MIKKKSIINVKIFHVVCACARARVGARCDGVVCGGRGLMTPLSLEAGGADEKMEQELSHVSSRKHHVHSSGAARRSRSESFGLWSGCCVALHFPRQFVNAPRALPVCFRGWRGGSVGNKGGKHISCEVLLHLHLDCQVAPTGWMKTITVRLFLVSCLSACLDGWMDECLDGWMDGWVKSHQTEVLLGFYRQT